MGICVSDPIRATNVRAYQASGARPLAWGHLVHYAVDMNDICSRSLFVVIAVMCVACTAESDSSPSVPLDALSSVDGGAEPLEDAAGAAPENTTTTPDTAGPDAGSSDDTPSLTPSPDAGAEKADLPPVDLTDTTGQEESGWPVNPDKGPIPDPGWDSVPAVGTVMPNFTATDQYGNQTELYDFAGQGVPVVIDVGTWFCEPCKALAAYLSDGDPSPFYEDNDEDGKADFLWWNESYEVVYDLVNNGELIWITVLYSLGDPVTAEDLHL